jgi:flagellar export protein FliJ
MADLDGLIRYRKHIVDEKQKILAKLFRQYEELEEYKQGVLKQVDHEVEAAKEQLDVGTQTALGLFVNASHNKVKKLEIAQTHLDVKIASAQESVRAAFAEQKKAEIVQRSRQKKERQVQDKKESSELDDIAIDGFKRKHDAQELEDIEIAKKQARILDDVDA